MKQTFACAALAGLTLAQIGPLGCIGFGAKTCLGDEDCCQEYDYVKTYFCHSDATCQKGEVPYVTDEEIVNCHWYGFACSSDAECC